MQVFWKIGALRNFAKFKGKHLCWGHFLIKISIKKTQAEVLSCEFCEILKNNFFTEHLRLLLWKLFSSYWNKRANPFLVNVPVLSPLETRKQVFIWLCWTQNNKTLNSFKFADVKGTPIQIWKSTYMFVFI